MSEDEGLGAEGAASSSDALRIRSTPEDFCVVEEPLYATAGEGNHTFVFVEKRGRTTEQVARELARAGGVSPRDVGYAGRKDRHAITRQWFSLEGVEPERALDFELNSAEVLEAHRHPHKIKTGHLRGNRFEIVLRGDRPLELDPIRERAASLLRCGMPNRYGEQRFGREGDNAEQARRLLADGRPPRDRRAARFLVSALQSEVFNAVLEERTDALDDVLLGDIARVEESGGLFWVDDLARERPRAKAFEISATGPIFGTKMRAPTDDVAELERAIFDRLELPDLATLVLPRGIRARGARRPLRVKPEGLGIESIEGGLGFKLSVWLPPGAYLTVLLGELVGPVVDASRVKPFTDGLRDMGVS
ncbi:MAG: tRNA pseudouridine(13) synthase TruD [bacterium]|nr:tRNA pseudouridine(13) synthase TruD [Deltaproteobacteria bacterium]MCP4904195.1 tRNA pseudouridine(13) synthase TruD [bacterium]